MKSSILNAMKLKLQKSRSRRITSAQRLTSRASSRRGVLLLVVLGMLTLFLMIGTAFIVSGNQYRKAEKSLAKFGAQENLRASQEGFLGEVISQLIRDTNNQNSALRFHSLLRDLYGTEGFRGEVLVPINNNQCVALAAKYAGANDFDGNSQIDMQPIGTNGPPEVFGPTAKQFIEFAIYNSLNDPDPERPRTLTDGTYFNLSTMPDHYAGQVLTWETGPLAGRSTRILKYRFDPALGYGILTVLAEPTVNDALLEPVQGPINSSRTPELTQLANIQEGLNPGAKFIVNGRPFNGTGVGYNPIATPGLAKLDAYESVDTNSGRLSVPIALAPNGQYFNATTAFVASKDASGNPILTQSYYGPNAGSFTAAQQSLIQRVVGFDGLGGSDESYDAPDFQNMFLAWTGPNVQDTIFTSLDGTPDPRSTSTNPLPDWNRANLPPFLGNIVLPSFHRPDLINFWANQTSGLGLSGAVPLLRKIMLRPNWHDHPDFTGSNPEYAAVTNGSDKLLRMIYGPWDVDNDNDGVRDSIWVDFGAPVMMDQKGRLVKPLAAIMVLDMDGRLNVNAHGTRELAGIGSDLGWTPDFVPAGTPQATQPRAAWNGVPRGQAFGVAEVTLWPLLNAKYDNLLVGGNWHNKSWTGRYGNEPGAEPGNKNQFDLNMQLSMQGYPINLPWRSNFGSLPDLRARYKSALNDFGQFVTTWTATDSNSHPLVEDNPYELDLSATGPRGDGTAADSPFSLAEFERVLRAFDVDAGTLPPRLFELLKGSDLNANLNDLANWRTLLTTDSFDLPEPSFQLPEWVKNGPDGIPGDITSATTNAAGYDDYGFVMSRGVDPVFRRNPVNATYADLIEYRILLEIFRRTSPANPQPRALTVNEETLLRNSIKALVAPEMLAGMKLDLNRPFGNGRDDDGNGVVDEPGEVEGPFWLIDNTRLSANEAANTTKDIFTSVNGMFRDNLDRNFDGLIEYWERGYNETNGDGTPQQRAANNASLTVLERVNLHNYRRQLLARYLYVMGMAVTDPLPPLDVNGLNTAIKNRKIKEYRRDIAARAEKMAQWAINVVDFRDSDSIMTPFEYDVYPFGMNPNTPAPNGPAPHPQLPLYSTWGVDGDIRTSTDLPNWSDDGVDNNGNGLIDRADVTELADRNGIDDDGDGLVDFDDYDEVAERQLVWGMERPELVMTETLAWHDRATEDLAAPFADDSTDENLDGKIDEKDEGKVGTTGGNFDRDFDQMFKPQGATFIELYNPWAPSPGASADTHLLDPNTGNDLGIALARTHNNSLTGSPVWRIDVRKTVDYNKTLLNPQLGLYVGGPDHDPDDPDYRAQPQMPDRCIYFTPFDPERYFPIQASTGIPKWQTAWDDDGVAFYSSLTNPTAPVDQSNPSYIRYHAVVRPGGYMVIGSGIPVDAGGGPITNPTESPGSTWLYEARIGDKKKGPDQRHAIVLNPNATGTQPSVWIRDKAGTPLQDQAGFLNSAPANTTSVAIIDSVWFRNISKTSASVTAENWEYRRFSVSEPASGYPLAAFASSFKGSYYNDPEGYYKPALDIPLDNQRWGRYQFNSGNVVDGQTIVGITSPKWMRKSGPSDKTATLELQKDNELRLTLPEKEQQSVRTIPAFSWLYLQRLANPMLPWNPAPGHQKHRAVEPVNPYVTVDSMAVNVTVFNGREASEKRIQEGTERDYGNNYAIRTFSSLQRGRNNEAIIEALLGRIREAQGAVPEPNGSGIPQKVADTGFRNLKVTSAMSAGMIREPHINGQAGGQPVAGSAQNLWGEERIGLVDKQYTNMSADFKKPFGIWMNRAGQTGDGLYKEAVSGSHYFHAMPDCTLGFLNEPYRNENAASPTDKQFIPLQPFSLITWNNRPFANPGEIIQVPAFRSSQLSKVFSFSKGIPPTATPPNPPDPKGNYLENYQYSLRIGTYPKVLATGQTDTDAVDSKVSFPEIRVDGPFGHLLNFFRTAMFSNTGADNLPNTTDDLQWNQGFAGMYRVLDLIEVPSRFVGTESWLNPAAFSDAMTQVTNTTDPRYGFQPPFNRIASRREPGRVNINTFSLKPVWDGIFHGSAKPNGTGNAGSHLGPDDDEFWAVRRGYDGIDPMTGAPYTDSSLRTHPLLLDRNVPSIFANPFRSTSAGDLVPLPQMRRPGGSGAGMVRSLYLPKVSQTNGQINPAATAALPTELVPQGVPFAATIAFANTDNNPFTLEVPANKHHDSARNPYYRYAPISRLSSLTTNRSNVFAVWVTIGFFEVHEINNLDDGGTTGILSRYGGSMEAMQSDPIARAMFNRVYPDGYTFGKEAGIDTGETVRYREFAIIDRTIPVGFEPGANHNTKETIRLQRKIE
jgi:hypothetical protein